MIKSESSTTLGADSSDRNSHGMQNLENTALVPSLAELVLGDDEAYLPPILKLNRGHNRAMSCNSKTAWLLRRNGPIPYKWFPFTIVGRCFGR